MKTMNIGRGLMAVILVLSLLLSFGGSAPVAASQTQLANDLRISQVYGGGGNSGATYTHDFIELFNAGTGTIDLSGYSVQYASSTGTSWQVTILAGSIGPGQYYLIQEAQGTGGTTPLPTPDAVGTIAMSATNGKLALVNTSTALSGSCPLGATVVDFVGFGSANCFEGSAATPVLSNTLAAFRADNGCTDTDDNSADFTTAAPAPRNTASPTHSCVVSQPSIALNKTVGTDPNSCATTHELALPADGGEVTYCYEVTNTGDIVLNLHDLDDSELGNIFSGLNYALAPAASAFITASATITTTTVNSALWTAYNSGPIDVVTATDVATVTVELANPSIALNKTVGTDPLTCATTDEIVLPPGGGEVTYCYEVENTGNLTLNLHDLDDSELGNIFSGLNYALAPAASIFVTETATIATTTVNSAQWTAYNEGGPSVTATDVATVTVEALLFPNIFVDPLSLSSAQLPDVITQQTLTISNTGDADLNWEILTEFADLGEGFDDITLLPGLGWFFQNNSVGLGTTNWFQGNDGVFPAQAGAATAYIGANFNNTSGVGTISNWMLTPEISLVDGDTISFWTRVPTGSGYPDRLEVRLSTNGASTNVGTLATDVGDFTTLLLSINPTLAVGGYPEVWTQFSVTLAGIPAGATGRVAFRYFVENAGPSGSNSDYIGIDTFEYISARLAVCDAPADVPWLSTDPVSGTTAVGGATPVDITFDSTAMAPGTYTANLCIESNDPDAGPGNETDLVVVPVELTVQATSIALTKTVGTVPGVCATTDDITVLEGTEVYYCFEIRNTGDVTLTLHDLVDTELGTILTALPYDLAPGALSPQVIVPATLSMTTVNTATWTAYNTNEPSVTATDIATVTVTPLAASIALTKTVGTVAGVCATTDDITVMEGTEVYYCYQIQNTGNVTLTVHDLVDTELGTILTAFPYDLAPGASSPTVIVPATLSVTTVNTATWTAYIVGGPTATATDSARVVVTPSAVIVTGLRASASSGWSSIALLGAVVFGGVAWRRKRR